MVPVETILGLLPVPWCNFDACEEMAWSSGVLEMMAEARLISDCFGGAEADFAGGEVICFSGADTACLEPAVSYNDGWLLRGRGCLEGEVAKASSASLSATFCWMCSLAACA